ncbi:MAG: site-specific DNA-methyltransferase [Tissierellia bacterium]|nr:site-specific DNA-methyltransferase [Tissierellia bacterium]
MHSIIGSLPRIIENGIERAETIINSPEISMGRKEIVYPMGHGEADPDTKAWSNRLYRADNLMAIKDLLRRGYRGEIDLIYIDPPFLTKSRYRGRSRIKYGNDERNIEYLAYDDTWKGGLAAYLEMIYPRLYLMRELLSDRGSIYIHLDYRTVHYVKVLMDQVFGQNNFLNEIIWSYKSGGTSRRYFSRKHDNILVYSKTKDYIFNVQKEKSYNRGFRPYGFKGVKEYEDEMGWYTLVNMRDVWAVDMVGRTSGERVDYDTQKPENLLERIILSSSNEDSIVADFFAGSGTTGVMADKLNRRWILADNGALATVTTIKRLLENDVLPFSIIRSPDDLDMAGKLTIRDIKLITDEEGREGLEIELGDYHFNMDNMDIGGKNRKIIEEVATDEPLALIDFIGIDMDYDGGIPIINWQNYRRGDRIIIEPKINIFSGGFKGKDIYIRYMDIFGQENWMVHRI